MAYFQGGDDMPGMIRLLDFVNTKMLQSVLPCYWRHVSVKQLFLSNEKLLHLQKKTKQMQASKLFIKWVW